MSKQNLTKIGQKLLKLESGNNIFKSIKGHNFAIPNHSFPISMSMQSLKKIGQKLLKLESGNEVLTDGHSKFSEGITYIVIPHHTKSDGV